MTLGYGCDDCRSLRKTHSKHSSPMAQAHKNTHEVCTSCDTMLLELCIGRKPASPPALFCSLSQGSALRSLQRCKYRKKPMPTTRQWLNESADGPVNDFEAMQTFLLIITAVQRTKAVKSFDLGPLRMVRSERIRYI